jgi:hypothetical protein
MPPERREEFMRYVIDKWAPMEAAVMAETASPAPEAP